MLHFDENRFLRIQSGAVALAERLHSTIGQCLDDGAQNLFFAGSGGAGILMQPAARLLQTRSTLPVFHEMPAELVTAGSVHLGPHSVVVIPSLSGTTQESIAALEKARSVGATVISLTGHADSPLSDGADHSFANFAEDDTSCESFYLQSLLVALSVLDHRGEIQDREQVVSELELLPSGLLEIKRGFETRAEALARPPPGRGLPHRHRRGIDLAAGVLLRHVHPRGDAVDPDPTGPRVGLLPRDARAGRGGRQRRRLQGRGRLPAALRAGRGVRPGTPTS